MSELSTHVGAGLAWNVSVDEVDVDFGAGAGTVCEGNDARLDSDRTADGIRTATTVVVVSAAAAPTNGQVLQATSDTEAEWATLGGGGPATQIDETGGPTTLNVGAIADLQLTRRNGTSFEGVTANASAVGLGNVTNHAQLQRAAGDFSTFATKAVPVIADVLLIEDSAAAGAKKHILIEDLPAAAPAAHISTHLPGASDPIPTATAVANPPGTASSAGSGTNLALANHTHALAAFGTGATNFCVGNDARLSDARTPTSHASTHAPGQPDAIATGTSAITVCIGNDARLSDSRAPNGSAGGDLSGSYPNPAVAKLTTTSGPTSLTIGAWTDGQILRRSGATAVGISVGTGAGTLAAGDDSRFSAAFPTYHFWADHFDSPVTSDWAVNSLAAASACTNNSGLLVRRFANATENGVGVMLAIPTGCTNVVFSFVSRAETTPAGTVAVIPRVYVREFPDNAAVESWSAGTDLTALSFPTNELWQYDTQTVALATLSLVAGQTCQIELTRRGSDGSDTLTTDWTLLRFSVGFT